MCSIDLLAEGTLRQLAECSVGIHAERFLDSPDVHRLT